MRAVVVTLLRVIFSARSRDREVAGGIVALPSTGMQSVRARDLVKGAICSGGPTPKPCSGFWKCRRQGSLIWILRTRDAPCGTTHIDVSISTPSCATTPQESLADYVLSVENISRTTSDEIKSAFERLNRNTAKLNNQELRKAQYEGVFISKMSVLAEFPFWSTIGVASRSRISRMLDVEYVSEIYLLTMHGIIDGNPSVLDSFYAQYDEEIPEDDVAEVAYADILEWVSGIDLAGTRWRNLGDLYSLWAATRELIRRESLPDQREAELRLRAFGERVADPKTARERSSSDAVRQGTNKDTSRKTRAEILELVLTGDL